MIQAGGTRTHDILETYPAFNPNTLMLTQRMTTRINLLVECSIVEGVTPTARMLHKLLANYLKPQPTTKHSPINLNLAAARTCLYKLANRQVLLILHNRKLVVVLNNAKQPYQPLNTMSSNSLNIKTNGQTNLISSTAIT